MSNDNNEARPSGQSLEFVLATLRRHLRLIALCVILTGSFAVLASVIQTKQYTSVASLLFRESTAASNIFGVSSVPSVGQDPARTAATNIQLVSLGVISTRTARAMGGNVTAAEVISSITVQGQGQSDLVLVEATNPSPELSQQMANTFAREFVRFRATADRSQLLAAKTLADREFRNLSPSEQRGPRGEQLSRGAERLGILASLQTGNAELVQPADLPTSPSAPKPVRNGILGIFLGLLLGIGAAFLAERLNRRLRTPEEAGQAFGLPVIGEIPESEAIADSNKGRGTESLPFSEEEAFRMLRASLRYFDIDREVKLLMISSSAAQVGKTTVAWHLARVAAKTSAVLLIESDLRNPSVSREDSSLSGPGLAEVLTKQRPLEDAIQEVGIGGPGLSGENGSSAKLSVITAGSSPPNPAELIESHGMSQVLDQVKGEFDFIVIDTPPIGVVADAFPLAGQVDGVVVVANIGATSRDSAEDLGEQLRRLEAPLLGVVANRVDARKGVYGYGYGYGYGEDSRDPKGAKRAAKHPLGLFTGS